MKNIKVCHHLTAIDTRGNPHTMQENDWVQIITFDRTRVCGWITHIGVDTIQIVNSKGDFSMPCSDIEEIDFWA